MNSRTTVILSVAVVLAAAGVYVAKSSSGPGPQPEVGPRALLDPAPQKVTRLELVAWGKPPMVFERDAEDQWTIVAPIRAPADGYKVDAEVTRLTGLKAAKSYGKGEKNAPGGELTRLEQPAWVGKLTDASGKTITIKVGAAVLMSNQTYVQLEGDERIYLVQEDLNAVMRSDLNHYRNTRVASFAANDAVRLTLDGARKVVLAKTDNKWTIQEPVRARADAQAVTSLLTSLSSLTAARFVDDSPRSLRIYGLEKPVLTLTVETETKKPKETPPGASQPAEPQFDTVRKTITVQLGATVEDRVFATLGGTDTPWVFQVYESTAKSLSPDLNKLREAKLIAGDVMRATRIGLSGPEGAIQLEKSGAEWRIITPPFDALADQGRAEFAAVDDLLKGLRDLSATAWEEAEQGIGVDYGFGAAATTVELVMEGTVEPTALTIGSATRGGTGVYVRNQRENAVAVVKAEAAAGLRVGPLAFVPRRLLTFDRNRAERIEVESGGLTRVVARTGGAWSLRAPVEAPAESKAVTDLLADLASLDARTIVGLAADTARFGLDAPAVACRVTVVNPPPPPPGPPASTQPATTQPAASQPTGAVAASQSGDATATPAVAAAPPSSAPVAEPPPPVVHTIVAARKDGKAYAYVAGGSKIGEIDEKVFKDLTAELHENKVCTLDISKLDLVELAYADRTLRFEKKGDDWRLEGEPGFKPDPGKLRQVAEALAGLTTQRYVDYQAADLARYGLDSPAVRATIRCQESTPQTLVIAASGPADDADKRRYATLARDGARAGDGAKVFLIAASDAVKFEKQIKDFEMAGP